MYGTLRDSTALQLLHIYHTFFEAVGNSKKVQVIFFDISKAFERVWHKFFFLAKLASFGITGKLLYWFKNYLFERGQRVVSNGCASEWTRETAGVPQGSILGPLLFLIYINDIGDEIRCVSRLFADLYYCRKFSICRGQFEFRIRK